jgi:hypothetical protein
MVVTNNEGVKSAGEFLYSLYALYRYVALGWSIASTIVVSEPRTRPENTCTLSLRYSCTVLPVRLSVSFSCSHTSVGSTSTVSREIVLAGGGLVRYGSSSRQASPASETIKSTSTSYHTPCRILVILRQKWEKQSIRMIKPNAQRILQLSNRWLRLWGYGVSTVSEGFTLAP